MNRILDRLHIVLPRDGDEGRPLHVVDPASSSTSTSAAVGVPPFIADRRRQLLRLGAIAIRDEHLPIASDPRRVAPPIFPASAF